VTGSMRQAHPRPSRPRRPDRVRNELALDLKKQANFTRLAKLSAEKLQLEETGAIRNAAYDFAGRPKVQKLSAKHSGNVEQGRRDSANSRTNCRWQGRSGACFRSRGEALRLR